jgi:hypothetical protein
MEVNDEKLKTESGVGDDFGDADLALGLIGRVLQDGLRRQARVRDVLTHAAENGYRVGGGIDSLDVELGQGLDVLEDGFQLWLEQGDFLVGEFEAGEIGDIADVDVTVRHGRSVVKWRLVSKCQVARMKNFKNFFKFFERL